MKSFKRFIAFIMVFACIVSICGIPAYAANQSSGSFVTSEATETIEYDGTLYVLTSSTEGSREITTIRNTDTGVVETIVHDTQTSTIYLNGLVAVRGANRGGGVASPLNETLPDGWVFLSSDTRDVTWLEGITAIGLATLFAYTIGVSPTSLMSERILNALSIIIDYEITGGELYVEIHMYTAPMINPQYRYVWEFTTNLLEIHIGPFYTHDFN